jgi:hypothetical protein
MGEMADYYLDLYWGDQDVMDDYFYGHHEDGDGPPVTIPCCKYCGNEHVEWRQLDNGKWRLHNLNGKVHTCKEYKKDR